VQPFDPRSLPRTAEYVDALPDGMASYAECRVRTDVSNEVFRRFPQVLEHLGISPEMVSLLRETSRGDDWMPDVHGVLARLLVRDSICESDQQFSEWSYDVAGAVFKRPLFRVLMYVLSPTLVLMGAGRRWAAFRRGTTLTAEVRGNGGMVELRYPDKLYTPLILEGFVAAFRASLVAARAVETRIELVESLPGRARWSASWR
jgi:hypothetical protein